METNTERERDDDRKENTQSDESVGYSEGTGSQGRSGLTTLVCTYHLAQFFMQFSLGKKRGGSYKNCSDCYWTTFLSNGKYSFFNTALTQE